MREKGIKEDRDIQQIAQAFANEKAAAKRKAADAAGGGGEAGESKPARKAQSPKQTAPSTATAAGSFTLDDLTAIEELARRVGGYEQLLNLVRWMAERNK
jgi:hypothetical protein